MVWPSRVLQDLPADSSEFLRPALGALVAINIGLNNFSLQFINAAMNQIVKAAMPVAGVGRHTPLC